ncbi:MAG TPA: rod shape-determining protein MreD [Candidatus Binatia bacterium]|nr:rod shape-determining protein MreD [Candidatus Binatia bacterium]
MRGLGMGLLVLVMIAAVVGVLLQTTVVHLLPLGPIMPDLVVILCVYLALHEHTVAGALGAFLLGYFVDNFSGNVLGLHAFSMSLIFLLVYLLARQLWMDNVVANVAVVFAASLLKALSIALLLVFYVSADYPWSHLFTTVWFEAAIAAMFTPFVFSVLDGGRRVWGIE